jgi:hypothetical protein
MGKDFDNYTSNDLLGNVNDQGCLSQVIPEANLELQMGKAEPSGVNNSSPKLLPSFVPPLSDQYSLTNLCCSCHITCCVEQVGLQQWGCNYVWQFAVKKSDEEDEEDKVAEENQVMQEDEVMENKDFNSNKDFQEDNGEYETPSTELGQEGVSVWDLLGSGFLKKASQLGESMSNHTFTIV